MNKLRIAPDSSRRPTPPTQQLSAPTTSVSRRPIATQPVSSSALPRSQAEQYWAARALTAETLLVARKDYERELKSIAYAGDTKKASEIAALQATHDARQRRMEHLVMFCVFCITSLIGLVLYLLISQRHSKPPQSRWGVASHFTIPILSPFTSVVEHEASVLGARIIVPSIIILAGLAYILCRRYWPQWRVS
ncbi:hypothetical protein FA95DRAFT_861012 [Auriscalpium vulgare]|uniref:Uncharacterized protein n=1 Tax=Auriscalpium vulgare TaxID=40419 RepID=A0ACB8RZR6_9AGAM|nr:hypothetical protein FA95DRAFT_861012 [Auriscalpium vulgare]